MSFELQSLDQSISSLSSSPSPSASLSPSLESTTPKTPSKDSGSDLESNNDRMEGKEVPEEPRQEIIDFLVMSNEIKKQRKNLVNLEKEYAQVRDRLSKVMNQDGVTNIDLDTLPLEFLQQVGGLGTIEIRHKETPVKGPKELSAEQFRVAVAEGLHRLKEGIDVDQMIKDWVIKFKAKHFPPGKMCRITTTHRKFQHATRFKRKPLPKIVEEQEFQFQPKRQKRNAGASSLFEPQPSWFQKFS
jgi:hypothetical protein